MAESPVAKKLGIKPGMTVLVLNPPKDLATILGEVPEDTALVTKAESGHAYILAFVSSKADIDRIGPLAVEAGVPEGALWFAYPKKTGAIKTDITRDVGWDVLDRLGYRPVTQVSLDETWTGFRFRPEILVKKR